MNQLSHNFLDEAAFGRMLSARELSRFSPSEVRQAIADLVAQDRMDLAQALGDAGFSLYPQSNDILAICALLAEARQDWVAAEDLLAKLILQQAGSTPVTTWQHYIRVLRCLCELPAALQIVEVALQHYPNDDVLLQEQASLLATLGNTQSPEGTDTRH